MTAAAQISLYPLRRPHLAPAIDRAQRLFEARGLAVLPGTMSTVVTGPAETLFAALQEAFREAAADGDVVMVMTVSNACPADGA